MPTEETPYFGQVFDPDQTTRVGIGQTIPPYVALSRELRQQWQGKELPKLPEDINSVEDFFSKLTTTRDTSWNQYLKDFFQGIVQDKNLLRQAGGAEENMSVSQSLQDLLGADNLDDFNQKFQIHQFTSYEDLRLIYPELWRFLIISASELQLAKVVLAKNWLKELPTDKASQMGVSKDELGILIDLAALTGKYVDHAYIKQLELADQAGGSSPSPQADLSGSEYIYDPKPASGSEQPVPPLSYGETFSAEIPKIAKNLKFIAKRVNRLLEGGKLDDRYKGLPAFLKQMANTYDNRETDPKLLDELWSELYQQAQDLSLTGCPIVIVPQGATSVAGEANKVDIEIRLGLVTPECEKINEMADQLRQKAQDILSTRKAGMSDPDYQIPSLQANYLAFAFGPNLFWNTQADASDEAITMHINVVSEVIHAIGRPLLQKFLSEESTDFTEIAKLMIADTVAHELAHNVLSNDDSDIRKRIGTSNEANTIDELKAETVGLRLLLSDNEEQPRSLLLAKICTALIYIKEKSSVEGSSGERYHYSGAAMIQALLDAQTLIYSDDKNSYLISEQNIGKGLEAIAAIGEQILDIYTDDDTKPQTVIDFVSEIKLKMNEPKYKQFAQYLDAH